MKKQTTKTTKTIKQTLKLTVKPVIFFTITAILTAVPAFNTPKGNGGISVMIDNADIPYTDENMPLPHEKKAEKSGPVTELPWCDNRDFIDAMKRNNTGVLLGAFRTVLRDPLPGEEYNVHLAAGMLAGIVVEPGAVFSQNGSIGPYTADKGFREGPTYIGATLTKTIGGGVCKIASTLYNVTVLSNLEIVERHAHSMPVPYVPYGQDATVAFGARDFKFRNNTRYPVLIWAEGIDNTLYMAFYGRDPAPCTEWNHEVLQTREAPRKYRINNNLADGEERVVLEGMDGAVVRSWVSITEGGSIYIKYMGVSDYKPMPYLIEINEKTRQKEINETTAAPTTAVQ